MDLIDSGGKKASAAPLTSIQEKPHIEKLQPPSNKKPEEAKGKVASKKSKV